MDETIRAVTYFWYGDTRFVDSNGSSRYTLMRCCSTVGSSQDAKVKTRGSFMHLLGTLEISVKTVCDREQGYLSYRNGNHVMELSK